MQLRTTFYQKSKSDYTNKKVKANIFCLIPTPDKFTQKLLVNSIYSKLLLFKYCEKQSPKSIKYKIYQITLHVYILLYIQTYILFLIVIMLFILLIIFNSFHMYVIIV